MADINNTNLGFKFNKLYYKGVNWNGDTPEAFFKAKNRELFGTTMAVNQGTEVNNSKTDVSRASLFKTTYPGLVVGLGYGHGEGNIGELKLGFSFDHTTGQPFYPGSSLKGMIRSAFPGRYKEKEAADSRKARMTYIMESIKRIADLTPETKDVLAFENEIFEGLDANNNRKSIYDCDIFYDSFIYKANSSGKLLAEDFITPHENPLKDPVPLMFMKILPNVTIGIEFDLQDSSVIPEMTAAKKRLLFEGILEDFGIGAKTNVGYGQLEKVQAS